MSKEKNLIVVVGQEGVGKSTICRALVPGTPTSAKIDADDIGQVSPCKMDAEFMRLVWKNTVALTTNYWEAGYCNVIAGSFFDELREYLQFRKALAPDAHIYLAHLCASKDVRDQRRIERSKSSSKEWRDWIDEAYQEDVSLGAAPQDYRYIRVDNDHLTIPETVAMIQAAIPEIYPRRRDESLAHAAE